MEFYVETIQNSDFTKWNIVRELGLNWWIRTIYIKVISLFAYVSIGFEYKDGILFAWKQCIYDWLLWVKSGNF